MSREPMTPELAICVAQCASNREFVSNWERLRGYSLPVSAIDRMIDEATGMDEARALQFIADVKDLVVDRLPWPPK